MTTVFPGAVDSLGRPSAGTKTNAAGGLNLSSVIDDISDAIEATETRVRQLANDGMVNGMLEATVASNALTVTLRTAGGVTPSSANPVRFLFRSVFANVGDPAPVDVTAATSLVISSGSTLGTASNTPFRLWVVAFNDAGTVRLAVINCRNGMTVYWLGAWGIATSTAEGGAGGADSSQTFYTGTAVTTKAYQVLGYLTWESGLATPGTWSSAPTRIEPFDSSTPLPGRAVQIQSSTDNAVATGTTQIPADDTIPQNTEGDQYMVVAVAPSSAANLLIIEHAGQYSTSVLASLSVALFQDSTANALASGLATVAGVNLSVRHFLSHAMLAGTTSITTFKLRAGTGGAATTTFNGAAGTRTHGGVINSRISVVEIMA